MKPSLGSLKILLVDFFVLTELYFIKVAIVYKGTSITRDHQTSHHGEYASRACLVRQGGHHPFKVHNPK